MRDATPPPLSAPRCVLDEVEEGIREVVETIAASQPRPRLGRLIAVLAPAFVLVVVAEACDRLGMSLLGLSQGADRGFERLRGWVHGEGAR